MFDLNQCIAWLRPWLLCAFLVNSPREKLTTETESTLRLHRERTVFLYNRVGATRERNEFRVHAVLESKKYFATVAFVGLRVIIDTTIINSAEIITIGTTGMKPKTAVPPGVRVRTS